MNDSIYTKNRLKKYIDSGDASVGEHTYGNISIIGNLSKLYLGKYCSIAFGCSVFLGHNHNTQRVSTYPFDVFKNRWDVDVRNITMKHPITKGNVHIGNDVWIGHGVTILSGVSIGDGAVIGACACVTKDVEPYAIVGGNPARFLKWRFPEKIRNALMRIRWWEWDDEKVNLAASLLCNDVNTFIRTYDGGFNTQFTQFPNTAQKILISLCKPFLRLFAPLEYCIKFETDPADFFAGSKNPCLRFFGALISCFGPRLEKTDFSIKEVRQFLKKLTTPAIKRKNYSMLYIVRVRRKAALDRALFLTPRVSLPKKATLIEISFVV